MGFNIPSELEYHTYNMLSLGDKKVKDRIIKALVASIRTIPEYKEYMRLCKQAVETCAVCGQEFKNYGVSKEFHHTPKTLYEIVQEVVDRYIESNQVFKSIDVIAEVVDMHLNGEVKGVIVCVCCHKLLHFERQKFGEEQSLPPQEDN